MQNTQTSRVLLTGGTDGIGLELANIFAREGHHLILVARSKADLMETAHRLKSQHGVDVVTLEKDLMPMGSASELWQEVQALGLDVDILVNNAGQGQYGLFADNDLNRELDIIHLNIVSLVTLTKHFVQARRGKGGKILQLSSIASKVPGPYHAVYHGTKAFVQSFSEAIRQELKDENISVTALLPGATDTDFFAKADMLDSKVVQNEDSLADATKVAEDGYKALMAGDDMVVSGLKNKLQVAMAAVTPDALAAKNMMKQQEPVSEGK